LSLSLKISLKVIMVLDRKIGKIKKEKLDDINLKKNN
jgi:hypothetical protein